MTSLNHQNIPVRVIIVTDGDQTAFKAVKRAARELNLYPLRVSAGNPTPLSGMEMLDYILQAPYDPVVVMVDDRGEKGAGPGEQVIEYLLANREKVQILGIVAVASDTRVRGVTVDCSIDANGNLVAGPVDKEGWPEQLGHCRLEGDTVEILRHYPEVYVVGCGDPGKMHGQDTVGEGAAITCRCLSAILERNGMNLAKDPQASISGARLPGQP